MRITLGYISKAFRTVRRLLFSGTTSLAEFRSLWDNDVSRVFMHSGHFFAEGDTQVLGKLLCSSLLCRMIWHVFPATIIRSANIFLSRSYIVINFINFVSEILMLESRSNFLCRTFEVLEKKQVHHVLLQGNYFQRLWNDSTWKFSKDFLFLDKELRWWWWLVFCLAYNLKRASKN